MYSRMRRRGGNDHNARLGFRRNIEGSAGALPGESLSYTELKQRYGQLVPAVVPRGSRTWLVVASLTILAAFIGYETLKGR